MWNQSDSPAANPAKRARVAGHQVASTKMNGAADAAAAQIEEPRHGQRDGALAAPALPDQSQNLGVSYREAPAIEHAGLLRVVGGNLRHQQRLPGSYFAESIHNRSAFPVSPCQQFQELAGVNDPGIPMGLTKVLEVAGDDVVGTGGVGGAAFRFFKFDALIGDLFHLDQILVVRIEFHSLHQEINQFNAPLVQTDF